MSKKLPFSRPENLTLLGTEREFRLGDVGDISLSFSFVVCSSLQVFFYFSENFFSRRHSEKSVLARCGRHACYPLE